MFAILNYCSLMVSVPAATPNLRLFQAEWSAGPVPQARVYAAHAPVSRVQPGPVLSTLAGADGARGPDLLPTRGSGSSPVHLPAGLPAPTDSARRQLPERVQGGLPGWASGERRPSSFNRSAPGSTDDLLLQSFALHFAPRKEVPVLSIA